MNPTPRCDGERGTSLILALVFIMSIAVFSVSVVALTGTSYETSIVARDRADTLYGADSGVEYALEQVRLGDPTDCPPSESMTLPKPSGSTLSVTATVECTGGDPGSGSTTTEYAAIATGTSGVTVDGTIGQSDNLHMTFDGGVYSGGAATTLAASGTTSDVTIDGNLDMTGATCPPVTDPPDPVITGVCQPNQAVPAMATTVPVVTVPTTPSNPAKKTQGNCTFIYPGTYTGSQFAFTANKGHYLASGTYYISSGTVSMRGWVRGGQPPSPAAPNDALLNGANPCDPSLTNDAWANANKPAGVPYTYTGTGVTIILGGTARLSMIDDKSTRVELFPRIPGPGSPDAASTPGVSIWGINSGTTPNYANLTQATGYLSRGKQIDVVVHGRTYLPNTTVDLAPFGNGEAGGAAQFAGGVVANRLSITAATHNWGVPVKIAAGGASGPPTPPTPRLAVITSTSVLDSGATTTIRVVAEYGVTAGSQPEILSWRKIAAG